MTITLSEAIELHLRAMRAKGCAQRSKGAFRDECARHLAAWLDRPLDSLRRHEIADLALACLNHPRYDALTAPELSQIEHCFPNPETGKPGVTHSAPTGPDGPFNLRKVVRRRLSAAAWYPPWPHLRVLRGRQATTREAPGLGG